MRRQGRTALTLLAVASIAVLYGAVSSAHSVSLFRYWWIIPWIASLASLIMLGVNLTLRDGFRTKVPARFVSGAYLANGPSLAAVGLSTGLEGGAPSWTVWAIPLLVALSALAYYRSLPPEA